MGTTQDELARQSNLNRAYISDIERGIRNPSLGVLWSIAAALNMPVSALLRAAEIKLQLQMHSTGGQSWHCQAVPPEIN